MSVEKFTPLFSILFFIGSIVGCQARPAAQSSHDPHIELEDPYGFASFEVDASLATVFPLVGEYLETIGYDVQSWESHSKFIHAARRHGSSEVALVLDGVVPREAPRESREIVKAHLLDAGAGLTKIYLQYGVEMRADVFHWYPVSSDKARIESELRRYAAYIVGAL